MKIKTETGQLKIENLFLYLLLSVSFCILFTSCRDEDYSLDLDALYEYAPVDSGHYVIYDVDSITYGYVFPTYHRDTARYQLMEVVGDTVTLGGELNYELNLYRRANDNSPWVFVSKWAIKRTTTNFQVLEDELRFIKLIFPPVQDEEWNGNAYIPTTDPYRVFQNWNYHYTEVNVPYSVNGLSFDSTLTVLEVDEENAIEKTLRKEVYAKHVGMIYQEWEFLTRNPNDDWETKSKSLFKIRMKVKEHN